MYEYSLNDRRNVIVQQGDEGKHLRYVYKLVMCTQQFFKKTKTRFFIIDKNIRSFVYHSHSLFRLQAKIWSYCHKA